MSVSQRALGGDIRVQLFSRERLVAIALGLVALLLVVLIVRDVLFPAGPAASALQTRTATLGTVRSMVSGTGTVVPASQYNLSFGEAGTLTEVDVKVGDQVKQGQVLAKIDATTFQNALTQANNGLTTAQAALTATLNGNAVVQAQHALANAQQSLADTQASVNLNNQQDANAIANDQAALSADMQKLSGDQSQLNGIDAPALAADKAAYASAGCPAPPAPPTTAQCIAIFNRITADQTAVANDNQRIQQDQSAINSDNSKLAQDQNKQAVDLLSNQKAIDTANNAVTSAQDSLNSQTIQRPSTIASQEAAVSNAQIAVQTAQKNLDQTTLTAPSDGTILSINGQVGENTSASTGVTAQAPGTTAPLPSASGSTSGSGSTAASSFMVLGNVSGLQIIAPFAEADAARLAASQTATVTFDAVTGLSAPAHVLAIASAATVISNVTNYYATLVIDRVDSRLKSGMTANASVIVQQVSNVLTLPNAAITRIGTLAFVNTLSSDGKTQIRRQIQIGTIGDQTTEIVSGLNQGDKVVLPTIKTSTTGPAGRGGFGGGGGGAVRIGG